MKINMKILDCTLRDGGYYTNWDFEDKIVETYIQNLNPLPIDYIELGYRNKPQAEYMGQYGYCPVSTLKNIRAISNKKLAVMLNEKDTRPDDLDSLLSPIIGIVDMVRLAVDPKNFDRAIILAKAVKTMGFEVAFNTMYMSTWSDLEKFYPKLGQLDGTANLFCMVDSYGSMTPELVKTTILEVRRYTNVTLGFHGHNNLQLALINTLTALENGVEIVDATILGMGRGAGNLNMELLLTYLNKHSSLDVDFNKLGDILQAFEPLHQYYQWGTSLPYMLSGANSIPQKEVMAWVQNRKYSLNSIVNGIEYKRGNLSAQNQYPQFVPKRTYDKVLIIGGGESAIKHIEAVKCFIEQNLSIAVVFATARFAREYAEIKCPKYYILVGSEAKRLRKNVETESFIDTCILPPSPHTMGTDVPEFCEKRTFELLPITFTDSYLDSCTTLAIETARLISDNIFIVGYDGYAGQVLSEKEAVLTMENRSVFEAYTLYANKALVSLTPTLYDSLNVQSIYQFI